MPRNRNRIIAKSRSVRPRKRNQDLLLSLPPDIIATILDTLREQDLCHIPKVCKSWASFFSHGSPLEPALRHFVRSRFGLTSHPPHTAHLSWGQLYLFLRKERCHLCPALDVAPFVYAGSASLSTLLGLTSCEGFHGLTLFPVCTKCFEGLLGRSREPYIPVVEKAAVNTVFPALPPVELDEGKGYIYSDIPEITESDQCVEYVLARPLANINSETLSEITIAGSDNSSIALGGGVASIDQL